MEEEQFLTKSDTVKGKLISSKEMHNISLMREAGIKMLADKSWVKIKCSEDGITLLSKERIHELVMIECLKIID